MISAERKAKLEAAGWKVGTVQEFLQLTEEENALVEAKLALGQEQSEGASDDCPHGR